MLRHLELVNYRGFQRYQLEGLSRINLLVGENNSGKTSILEALHLLASGGHPTVFAEIAFGRGEVAETSDEGDRPAALRRRGLSPVVSHFFHGHELWPGGFLELHTDTTWGHLVGRILELDDIDPERQKRLPFGISTMPSPLVLHISRTDVPIESLDNAVPLDDDGSMPSDLLRHVGSRKRANREEGLPVEFITTDSLGSQRMGEMWGAVLKEGRERDVAKALSIIEPGVQDVAFQPQAASGTSPAGILVGLGGVRQRVPLGSLGDGMRRLLALSISLIQASGGLLLIDEIDTGLHYSVMGDMWRLVTQAAIDSNIQVFAATHSLDCLQGLAWLCENYPELGEQVCVQKIDARLSEADAFHADNIKIVLEQGIEVR